MMELKHEQPKNKLIKFLTSTMYGNLSQYNYLYLDPEEVYESDIETFMIISEYVKPNGDSKFKIINKETPCKFGGMILLKSIISSYGRLRLTHAINIIDKTPNIDKLVRTYTDSIIFNEKVEYKKTKYLSRLLPEEKTTGKMYFTSLTSYYNLSKKEGHGKYKKVKSINDMKNIIKNN
jgi:hypothetical protein